MRKTASLLTKSLLIALAFVTVMSTMVAASGAGTITASALRVRSEANNSSGILGLIPNGATVELLEQEGEWYLTNYSGFMGYIHSDYVEVTKEISPIVTDGEDSMSAVSAAAAAEAARAEVANLACEFIGARYVYGGASPSGFDCSGFTLYIYKQFGFSLPHSATSQLAYGEEVAKEDLKPGDLVFFRDTSITRKAASHVGVYIGDGQFVHASSSRTGYVKVNNLTDSYFRNIYVGARRLITG